MAKTQRLKSKAKDKLIRQSGSALLACVTDLNNRVHGKSWRISLDVIEETIRIQYGVAVCLKNQEE